MFDVLHLNKPQDMFVYEDGNLCDDYEYNRRLFLVLSNLAFVFPCILAVKMNIKLLFPEIIAMIATMICSINYHLCYNLFDCSKTCISNNHLLLKNLDFIFSFQMIIVGSLLCVDKGFFPYKSMINVVFLFFNVVYVVIYKDKMENDNLYISVLVTCGVLLFCAKMFYIYKSKKLFHFFRKHFNLVCVIMTIACLIIGIMCFFAETTDETYWYVHSMWHIGISMCIFFEILMYDTRVLQICSPRRNICLLCETDYCINEGVRTPV